MKYSHIIKYPILLLILYAFMACTQQEWVEPSDEVTVTFSITPEQALGTRAMSGQEIQVNRLVCAVYDIKGNLLPEFGNSDNGQIVMDFSPAEGVRLPLRLVRGQEYKVVFWASCSDCEAYDTSDLSRVTIDYTRMQCNDSKCDAFCKAEAFTVTSAPSMERTVRLRRPFAQINVGIPESDYKALANKGKEIKSSKITLGPVANVIDAVNNSVSTDNTIEEIAFPEAPVPDGNFTVQTVTDDETTEKEYKYLAMCYLLVADKNDGTSTYSSELKELTVTLHYDGGSKVFTSENVPVERNWSTNIFLTEETFERE